MGGRPFGFSFTLSCVIVAGCYNLVKTVSMLPLLLSLFLACPLGLAEPVPVALWLDGLRLDLVFFTLSVLLIFFMLLCQVHVIYNGGKQI